MQNPEFSFTPVSTNAHKIKHASLIGELKLDNVECDMSLFKSFERPAFRWTFEKIEDERNFTPPYLLNNGKRKKEDQKKNKLTCLGYALSLYPTMGQAKGRLEHLTEDKPELFRKLGTHIAEGMLKSEDGVSGEEDVETGHFSLFEYEKAELDFEVKVKVAP